MYVAEAADEIMTLIPSNNNIPRDFLRSQISLVLDELFSTAYEEGVDHGNRGLAKPSRQDVDTPD